MDIPPIHFNSESKKPLKIGNKECHSVYDFSLTEEEMRKARKELNETEEKTQTKVQEIRDKLANEKDVICRTDTPYLLRFLRIRKYDSVRAYQSLKESYIFRKGHPDCYHIPVNLEQLLNRNFFISLPYTDENGNVIIFFDIDNLKIEETSFEEIIQTATVVADVISMNPRMQINGIIAIYNMSTLTVQHIYSAVRIMGIRGISFVCQKLYPFRLKHALGINTGATTRLLYQMTRPFISKKVTERIHLLGYDITELHKYVNPALLPKKLGGCLDESQYSVTKNIIENISYVQYERSFSE